MIQSIACRHSITLGSAPGPIRPSGRRAPLLPCAAPTTSNDHVSNGPDLTHFVHHRMLDVYEQSMARQGYAYGVDLRRSRWLASSVVGNALVRAVDRAWPHLS